VQPRAQLVLNVVDVIPFSTQSYLTTPVQVWPASTTRSKLTLSDLTPDGSIDVGPSNRFGVFRLTVEFPPFCKATTLPKSKVTASALTKGATTKKERTTSNLNSGHPLVVIQSWLRWQKLNLVGVPSQELAAASQLPNLCGPYLVTFHGPAVCLRLIVFAGGCTV